MIQRTVGTIHNNRLEMTASRPVSVLATASASTVASAPASASVGALVARLAAACFQGREPEISRFMELVREPGHLPHVVFVTGPPGIGKSALMEAVRWRLHGAGLADVLIIDTHDFDRSPEGIERIVAERAAPWPRRTGDMPLVLVLDGYDSVGVADRRRMRENFTANLTGPVLVVFGERCPPADLLVAQVGWRSVMEVLPLGPLQAEEATALLEAHGVNRSAAEFLALEAMGNPLLTAVVGDLVRHEADSERWPDRFAEEATRLLASRLVQEGLDAHGFGLVETASLIPRVSEEKLAAMLHRDIVDEFPRFAALSVVVKQPSGEYAVAEPFRSLVARDVQRRRPLWCEEVQVAVAKAVRAVKVAPTYLDLGTRPPRELLPEVKSALEWHRHGRRPEPCRLASRLHLVGRDGAEQMSSLLTGIVRYLVDARGPRVSEAGRLLAYYYFDRAESLEAVAERMNISRATAFRRLTLGIELVAERLSID